MQSNYEPLGDFIKEVKTKNSDLGAKELLGINIDKFFMPSVANIVGVDLSKYKVVKQNQFACNRMHVGRDGRIPVALSQRAAPFIVSPAYDVFEIKEPAKLLPEYLMMWFSRREFDRNAWFYTDADVRGGLAWKAFCNMKLPVPALEKQREIVAEYHTIQNRITLNNQLIKTLETTTQAIYKQWFVEFEFPNETGQPYKSSGGELVDSELGEIPKGWEAKPVYDVAKFINGASFKESDFSVARKGLPIIKIAELKKGVDEQTAFTENKVEAKYRICNGDVLYSWSGNPETSLEVFKWFGGDAWVNQHIFKLAFNTSQSKPFVFYLLKELKPVFVRLATGKQTTGLGHITVADLKQLRVAYPPDKLMKHYERMTGPFFETDSILTQEQNKLSELANLLLSKLATIESPTPAPVAPKPAQLTLALA